MYFIDFFFLKKIMSPQLVAPLSKMDGLLVMHVSLIYLERPSVAYEL